MTEFMTKKSDQALEAYALKPDFILRNRLVMAPMTTWSGLANGEVSDQELAYYKARSAGVGMVITATTYAQPNGQGFSGQFYGGDDAMLPSLTALADTIKSGGAKAILQIFHAGRKGNPLFIPGGQTVSASAVAAKREVDQVPRALSPEEIEDVIVNFYEATVRAYKAGFDGIEIHGANTYLLQQFFSPHSNCREDQWGGSLEERGKFPLAVIAACLQAVKDAQNQDSKRKFIVGYRFSPEENSEPGITMTDTEYLIDQLCQTQLDYLHVSLGDYRQGSIRPLNASEHNQGVLLDWVVAAVAARKPLIGVGSVRTLEDAQKVIQGGSDMVAIGRQLLIDPETVEKWHRGELAFDAYDAENREALVIPQKLHEIIVAREDWVPLKG